MKNKIISIFIVLLSILAFNSCKTKEYIEVPVEVERVRTEYIHKLDSIYKHDSIYINEIHKGDTTYITKYLYKYISSYLTDTLCTVDSIPVIVPLYKIVETNTLYTWQKILMYIGGVGILILLGFITYKFKIWKLLF